MRQEGAEPLIVGFDVAVTDPDGRLRDVRGFLDNVKTEDVTRFEKSYLEEVRAKLGDVLEAIRKERELSKATEDKLTAFLTNFTKTFV